MMFGQAAATAVRLRRHQPSRPPAAMIRPGTPVPTIGPGTARLIVTELPCPRKGRLAGTTTVEGEFMTVPHTEKHPRRDHLTVALTTSPELLAPAIEVHPTRVKLSVVIPCYNEEKTLKGCV